MAKQSSQKPTTAPDDTSDQAIGENEMATQASPKLVPAPEPDTLDPTVDAQSETKIPSPFDPAALRCDQSVLEGDAVKKLPGVIDVRKPGAREFIRVNPDQNYTLTSAALIEDEDGEIYLVTPTFVPSLSKYKIKYRVATIFTAITNFGSVFLWPVYGPDADGKHNKWHKSSGVAAKHAMSDWVRVTSNRKDSAYETFAAEAPIPEPEWPEQTFTELLQSAFEDKLVGDPNRAVVLKLRGRL